MKKIIVVFSFFLAVVSSVFAQGQWFTDFDAAKKASVREKKPLFILFTGSDWCPWCVKLEKEILSRPEFQDYAKKNLVLFKADFTRKLDRKSPQGQQYTALMKKYGAQGFPTVYVESPSGEVIGKAGYMRGGPEPFIRKMETILKQGK